MYSGWDYQMIYFKVLQITSSCLKILCLWDEIYLKIGNLQYKCSAVLVTSYRQDPTRWTPPSMWKMRTFQNIIHRCSHICHCELLRNWWSLALFRRQTTMPVICSQCFWKGCICFISVYFHFFSFQRKFNNHLKILTTTIWSTISRFYHCYFILRWNVLFFTFLFSTRKRVIRFIFFFLQDVW